MPTIRIDDAVMQELEKRAVQMNLVFGSPNQVLRMLLRVDTESKEAAMSEPASTKPAQREERSSAAPIHRSGGERMTGRRLLSQHRELPRSIRPYADREGKFYEWPRDFPAVLFDKNGYVVFQDEADMLSSSNILAYPETSKVVFRSRIASLPRYKPCSHKQTHG